MKRIVSLWLPQLPLDRLSRQKKRERQASSSPSDNVPTLDDSVPFALVTKEKNGIQILACNTAAKNGGVATDMTLTDARALLPSLVTQPSEPEKDARTLLKLAEWCQRYTPIVALDGHDALMLDITGAAHLLGGEANLLHDLKKRLEVLGFQNRLGLAGTPGAAWAMARLSADVRIGRHEDPNGKLSPLPVEALRLDDASLKMLKRFGLKRTGQLLDMPRQSLERRFNSQEVHAAVVRRLDQMLGRVQEPLVPLIPPPLYYERVSFPEPILQTEGFYAALRQLLEALCTQLENDHKGARVLTFSAYRADGGVSHVSIQTARPSRNEEHFAHLFRDKIETINPGFGVDVLILSAGVTEPLGVRQTALGRHQKHQRHSLATLIDRLSNRLGPHAITRRTPFESYLPERAEKPIPALAPISWGMSAAPVRPLRLFDWPEPIEVIAEIPDGPPRMFRWRRVMRRIVKATGPERIAPEWWRDLKGRSRTRDYYTLEDENGRRYWLYRAGLYDGEESAAPPQWRMHGVFA